MEPNPFIKQYLMTAGPTPLPPAVSQVMAEPVLYHRAPLFSDLYERVLERLRYVFCTKNDVLVFAASGTGGLESAVANLISPKRPVLVCAAGKFGERWIELCRAYGADCQTYEPGWGHRFDPAALKSKLAQQSKKIEVVFTTLSETSTGVVHDIRALAEVVNDYGAMLVVDAVSGIAATELRQDEWGIDVVVAGSQKALMCPPGLAFASVSARALSSAADNSGPRYYFDWVRAAKAQRAAKPQSPFTPAVNLLRGLDVALGLIEHEGLDTVLQRHDLLARATRAGVHALGLELFGDPDERATVVTAVQLPGDIDGARVPTILREIGVTANGGQGELKAKIVRIAHCGYFGAFDILIALAGLELTLKQLGHHVQFGSAVGAAQTVFYEAGVDFPAPR